MDQSISRPPGPGDALGDAPVFVYRLGADGKIRWAAGNGLDRIGLRPEQLVGVEVTHAFAHNPEVLRQLREVLAGRKQTGIHLVEMGLDLESWLEPVYDAEGRLLEVIGVSLDVADFRAAQAEVGARQRFLAAIIDSLPMAISVRDEEGRYAVVNQMVAEGAGQPVEELLGKNLEEVWGSDFPLPADQDQKVLANGVAIDSQMVFGQGPDARQLSVHRSPITLPDGRPGVLTVGEDVTERLRGLAAVEVSEAKSRFFASVNHELRAPLNSILGFANLFADTDSATLTPRQRRYLDNIRAAGDHLLALINDLLDLSRLEAGKFDLQAERVSLTDACAEVVERMGPTAAVKGVSLECHAARRATVALADRRRVDQVLYNLVSNAIKFTPAGGTVKVSTPSRGDRAGIAVTDSGVGIAPADQERIFEEFTQLGSGSIEPGSGLGLSVVKGLVERMGGKVELVSALGRGSTFTAWLPKAPPRRSRSGR